MTLAGNARYGIAQALMWLPGQSAVTGRKDVPLTALKLYEYVAMAKPVIAIGL